MTLVPQPHNGQKNEMSHAIALCSEGQYADKLIATIMNQQVMLLL